MKVVWGTDDCLTFIFGNDYKRPRWIKGAVSEKDAMKKAIEKFDSVHKGWEDLLKKGGYKQVKDIQPYDVVICDTDCHSHYRREDAVKIFEDMIPYNRAEKHICSVKITKIYSIWRKK